MRGITYLGERQTEKGEQPDREKNSGLSVSKLPGKVCSKLRRLLESYTKWQWKREHVKEWLLLKGSLTKEPVLKFYDQDKPLKGSTDASKFYSSNMTER